MTSPTGQARSVRWLRWPLLVLGLALLTRAPVFVYPYFLKDEPTYSTLAVAMLEGRPLYVEAVDHKPPAISATYALIHTLFGTYRLHPVHAVSILVVALTALLITAAARRWGLESRASRLAGLLYLLFSVVGPGKDMLTANAELFMLLPTAGAVLLYLLARPRAAPGPKTPGAALLLVAAGALGGLAFLYKYQGGAVLGTLCCLELARSWRHPGRLLGVLLAIGVGVALVIGGVVLWYWHLDEQAALAFWAWTYPLHYSGLLTTGEILRNALVMTPQWAGPCLALLVTAAWGVWRLGCSRPVTGPGPAPAAPPPRAVLLLGLLWLLWGLVGVAAGGRFFLHYYLQALPGLAVLAAPVWCEVLSGQHGRRWRQVLVVGAIGPVLAFGVANVADHRIRPHVAAAVEAHRTIGEWVAAHSTPAEKVFVWGNSPEIHHFSGRGLGTRFPFTNYHSGKIWGTIADEEGAPDAVLIPCPEAWPMLLADLDRRRPALIVDAAAAGLERWRGHAATRYPELATRLARDYRQVATVAGAPIYRRRETISSPPAP